MGGCQVSSIIVAILSAGALVGGQLRGLPQVAIPQQVEGAVVGYDTGVNGLMMLPGTPSRPMVVFRTDEPASRLIKVGMRRRSGETQPTDLFGDGEWRWRFRLTPERADFCAPTLDTIVEIENGDLRSKGTEVTTPRELVWLGQEPSPSEVAAAPCFSAKLSEIALVAGPSAPALKQALERRQISKYLTDYFVGKNERDSGIPREFTNSLSTLSPSQTETLKAAFPRHNFVRADVPYIHSGVYITHMVLIADAMSGDVVAHVSPWSFDSPSDSFYRFLSGYKPTSRSDGVDKVRALASIISLRIHDSDSERDARGDEVTDTGKTIVAELRDSDANRPDVELCVDLDRNLRFGRISLVRPRE